MGYLEMKSRKPTGWMTSQIPPVSPQLKMMAAAVVGA